MTDTHQFKWLSSMCMSLTRIESGIRGSPWSSTSAQLTNAPRIFYITDILGRGDLSVRDEQVFDNFLYERCERLSHWKLRLEMHLQRFSDIAWV